MISLDLFTFVSNCRLTPLAALESIPSSYDIHTPLLRGTFENGEVPNRLWFVFYNYKHYIPYFVFYVSTFTHFESWSRPSDRSSNWQTDRQTDGQTDIVTYRSAIAAKMKKINIQKIRIKTIAKQTFYSNKLMNQHKFLCFNKCIYFSWFYKNLSHWNVIWSCFHFS